MRLFQGINRQVLHRVIENPQLGFWLAALFIVPAASVSALYPMNWILGTLDFNVSYFELGYLRPMLVIPILLAALLFHVKRSLVLALMLLPVPVLMLTAPDRLGASLAVQGGETTFYPDTFDGEAVRQRITRLQDAISKAGWLYEIIPPHIPTTEKVSSLSESAVASVNAWRGATSNDVAAAAFEEKIKQLESERQSLLSPSYCRSNNRGSFFRCRKDALRKAADNQAQIAALSQQVSALRSGPSADSLYPLAVDATTATKVELEIAERLVDDKISFIYSIPYIITASIAFILLVYVVGFQSSALAVLLGGTLMATIWSALPLSPDHNLVSAVLILYPVYMCVLSAFVLRFLFRAYLDNRVILEQFSARKSLWSAFLTMVVWLPFPVIVATVVLFNQWIYATVSDAIYCKLESVEFCKSVGPDFPIHDSDPSRDTLHQDVNAAIVRQLVKFEVQAVRGAEAARSNVAEQVEAAKQKIIEVFKQVLPDNIYQIFPELKPPESCRWLLPDIKCFARKIALVQLNKAYQRPRNRLLAKLENKMAQIGGSVVDATTNAADALQASIKGESQAAALYATRSVDATFVALSSVAAFQMAFMILVITRGYLLGFGRMLYRAPKSASKKQDSTPYLALTHTDPLENADVSLKLYPHEFDVDHRYLPLIAKRSYGANNAYEATLLAKSFYCKWPIKRFLNRCLFLRRVTEVSSSKTVTYTSGSARQFVVWSIPPKSEVYFRWDQFVAVSESLRLRKEISLRIGGLTLGTTMHAYVESNDATGILIQESFGKVELVHKVTSPSVSSPFRLMSWRDDAQFKISSPAQFASIYLDTSSLDPRPKSRAALDADGGRSGGLGILRELIMLMRP